jgi:hypothetical protein
MTSAQLRSSGDLFARALLLAACLAAGGCGPKLERPQILVDLVRPGRVWAVAPFANESGVSAVDTERVADLFTQQLQQVLGVDTVPVNRVILAMRDLGMPAIASPHDALRLILALEVDVIVVGTVTAYDPYPPPTLGAAVQAFTGDGNVTTAGIGSVQGLVRAPSGDDEVALAQTGAPLASAQAAGVFDASSHQTLAWLQTFATGRTEPGSPFGPDIYLVSMELYTQFVSYRLIHDLLAWEQVRQRPLASQPVPR